MGGTDDSSNIVKLSVEDHSLAHKALYEQHGHWEDKLAWRALSGIIAKEDVILELQREAGRRVKSPEERAKLSKSLTGRTASLEHRANISKGLRLKHSLRPTSAETKAKMVKAHTGYKHTPETKEKLSLIASKRIPSESTKKKISESMKAYRKSQRDDSCPSIL